MKLFYLLLLLVSFNLYSSDGPSYVFNEQTYGATPDKQGPIGGGNVGNVRYQSIFKKDTPNVKIVKTADEFIEKLKAAKSGDVIFIPVGTTITFREKGALTVNEGVTIAGERTGKSPATLDFRVQPGDSKDTTYLKVMGPNVRITGLIIKGSATEIVDPVSKKLYRDVGKPYNKNGIIAYYSVEVDNCDISGFAHAGIYLVEQRDCKTSNETSKDHRNYIHHNHIHHCRERGLGYGVCVGKGVLADIMYNKFDNNRHSIASPGGKAYERYASYTAMNNLVILATAHAFDVHGGQDRKDGTYVAGGTIIIKNNSFYYTGAAVKIRGIPAQSCTVTNNYFVDHVDNAVFAQIEVNDKKDEVQFKDLTMAKFNTKNNFYKNNTLRNTGTFVTVFSRTTPDKSHPEEHPDYVASLYKAGYKIPCLGKLIPNQKPPTINYRTEKNITELCN